MCLNHWVNVRARLAVGAQIHTGARTFHTFNGKISQSTTTAISRENADMRFWVNVL